MKVVISNIHSVNFESYYPNQKLAFGSNVDLALFCHRFGTWNERVHVFNLQNFGKPVDDRVTFIIVQ